MTRILFILLLISLTFFQKVTHANDYLSTMLQPEQVAEDLDQWLAFLDKTHPQLSYTIKDVEAFHNDVEALKRSVTQPISVLEFWKKVSVFNSVLNDGHTVINLPKLKTLTNQHINGGGGVFPFDVIFDRNKLIINSAANGEFKELRGSEITHINGQKTSEFIKPLLQRTNGDSDRFRKAVLQRRFAEYVWLYYGHQDTFIVELNKYGQQQTKTVAAKQVPFNLDDEFSEEFKFEILDSQNALLTINTFYWGAEYKEVIKFLHNAFAIIAKNNIKHLIIDIRQNGGGDDIIWIDGILPYLADKAWRTGSKWKAKVIEGRADEGDVIGEVMEGENSFKDIVTDVKKYEGEVSVLISAFTYSSSILFANVMQDHGFGQLVGETTGGKSGQTGGTQFLSLKHSNLRAISPFFYLERPKGGQNHAPVTPDIAINYDKTIPEQLVNKLINRRNLTSKTAI